MFLPKNYLNYTKIVYIIFYLSSKNTLHVFNLHKCTKYKQIRGRLYIYQLFTVTEYRYSSSTHLTLKKFKPNSSPHTPTKKIIVKNFRTHPIFTLKTSIFQTLKSIYLPIYQHPKLSHTSKSTHTSKHSYLRQIQAYTSLSQHTQILTTIPNKQKESQFTLEKIRNHTPLPYHLELHK